MTTGEKDSVDNVKLLCRKADWYKVNFFPASAYGKKMSLRDFKVKNLTQSCREAKAAEVSKISALSAPPRDKITATATYVHFVDQPRLDELNKTLQQRGFKFSK